MTENNDGFVKPVWRGRKRHDIYMSDGFAIVSVAASMISMIFLGKMLILLFYVLWLPRMRYKGQWTIKPSKAMVLPVAIILFSLASTFWSVHSSMTLRAGLQFATVIFSALIMSRIVRIDAFIKGVALGMSIALLIVLISVGGIHTGVALAGSLGSKNQVGLNAELGVYCALMCWFIFKKYWSKILIALPAIIICGGCLLLSRSATSIVSLVLVLFVSYAAYILQRFPKKFRVLVLIFSVLLVGVVGVMTMSVNFEEIGLEATGKDATLTGRTTLWAEGIKAGMENPVLGVGLDAFWVHGMPVAERMWYKFGIPGRSGFHFHNLFVNIFVEIGLIGTFLWVLMYLSTCVKSCRDLLKDGYKIESVFYVGMIFMFLIRSMVEADTTGPYGTGVLIFFYIVFRVSSRKIGKETDESGSSSLVKSLGNLQLSTGQKKI